MPIIFTRRGVSATSAYYLAPSGVHYELGYHEGRQCWTLDRCFDGRGKLHDIGPRNDYLLMHFPASTEHQQASNLAKGLTYAAAFLKEPVALRVRAYTAYSAEELKSWPHCDEDLELQCAQYQHSTGTLRVGGYLAGVWHNGLFVPDFDGMIDAELRTYITTLVARSTNFGGKKSTLQDRESWAQTLNEYVALNCPGRYRTTWVTYQTDRKAYDKHIEALKPWHGDPYEFGALTRQIFHEYPVVKVAQPYGPITEEQL